MKFIKRFMILLIILITTGCSINTIFTHKPLQQTMHSAVYHTLPLKVIPDTYLLKPISNIDINANSAILINTTNGEVLFDKNSHEPLGIASMSKIMSELLVLEALENNELAWDDSINVSDYAYTISHQPGFASIKLQKDKTYQVSDLFKGMAVTSANGATIALAEEVAGSEKAFVTLMNKKAKELGLEDTYYVNSTGLTNSDLQGNHTTGAKEDYNKMSASDLATLTSYIIDHYPDILEITRLTETEIEGEKYENSNWMLPGTFLDVVNLDVTFPGVDGLKTGYTSDAGYGFTGTVEIGESRFISVVIGTDSMASRFQETGKLYKAILEQLEQSKTE